MHGTAGWRRGAQGQATGSLSDDELFHEVTQRMKGSRLARLMDRLAGEPSAPYAGGFPFEVWRRIRSGMVIDNAVGTYR